MSLLANSAVIGGEIDTGDIGHSLRFRSAASAYLSRTPASEGNRKTFTLHFAVKRGAFVQQRLFSSRDDGTSAGNTFGVLFDASNRLAVYDYASAYRLYVITNRVFRDVTSPVFITIGIDTTQAVAANRVTIEVNGVQETSFATSTYPAQNIDLFWNDSGHIASIGRLLAGSTSSYYLDGYLSRVCGIDGAKVSASSLLTFNTQINEWITKTEAEVKAVVNAGGANSFMLEFKDATSLTTLGYDNSSKGNNWTLNNFSLTVGSTYDHMLDVPGNSYATLNSLKTNYAAGCSAANLSFVGADSGYTSAVYGSIGVSDGAFYFECQASGRALGVNFRGDVNPSNDQATGRIVYHTSLGNIYNESTAIQTGLGASSATDTIGVAIDATNRTLQFYKNGVVLGTSISIPSGYVWFPFFATSSDAGTFYPNFGQAPLHASATYRSEAGGYFRYAPPTGFTALCQASLSDSGTVIVSGSFTGNVSADGPCIWMNGTPKTLTINGNAVTFGTHADRLATGFKIRTASTSYNSTGTNTWTATIDSNLQNIFKYNNGEAN